MNALTILILAGLGFTALWCILSYSALVQYELYRISRLIRHPLQWMLRHRPPPAMTRKEFVRQFNEGLRVGYRLTAMGRFAEDDTDNQFAIMNTVYSAVSQQRKALQGSIDASSDRLTTKINQLMTLCQNLDRKVADNQSVLIVRGIKLEEEHNTTQRWAQSIRDDVLQNQQTLADIRSSVRKILKQINGGPVLADFDGDETGGGDRHGDGAAGHQDRPADGANQEDGATGGAISKIGGAAARTGGGGHSDSSIEAIETDSLTNPAAADHIMRLLDRDSKRNKTLRWYPTATASAAPPPPVVKKEPGLLGTFNKTVSCLKSEDETTKE